MTDLTTTHRSRSRDLTSSGRGGIGNIHNAVDPRTETGPDDISVKRGREPAVHPDKVFSTGRGGAGNIRSPSRDVAATTSHAPVQPDPRQEELIRAEAEHGGVFSTGRGGIGNISRSRSRGPSPKEDSSRSASHEHEHQNPKDHHSGVSDLLHKVLHPHHTEGHSPSKDVPKESAELAPPLNISRIDAK
ncbi:hypothetical protein BT96DRAFT_1012300 [Gymnopus androsaceus JB14]|uniref:Uncharacterized protein n=1 Tax=Gymnopus androsaceus JB14 TaxID=1447944 RepID=A0A6A4ICX1_9AGAR|nr:hypothetical protein BT96DRAFT_1012300 [Gymnopus androsaceus JB14]